MIFFFEQKVKLFEDICEIYVSSVMRMFEQSTVLCSNYSILSLIYILTNLHKAYTLSHLSFLSFSFLEKSQQYIFFSSPTPSKSIQPSVCAHTKSHRWDSWVAQDRLLKLTEENKELAKNLKKGIDAARQRTIPKTGAAAAASKKRVVGSDLGSAQGSEERHSSLPAASGRGPKRGRGDFEIEKVCRFFLSLFFFFKKKKKLLL